METLIGKFSRLVSGDGVYPCALVVFPRDLLDTHNSILQLLMHGSIKNRTTDIVA